LLVIGLLIGNLVAEKACCFRARVRDQSLFLREFEL
jgi:hypothetical protein